MLPVLVRSLLKAGVAQQGVAVEVCIITQSMAKGGQ